MGIFMQFGGFHGHGGTQKWVVFVRGNPIRKWMMPGGSPMTQETSIFRDFQNCALLIEV